MTSTTETKRATTKSQSVEHRQQPAATRRRVGLAFQGGCFLSGAVAAGVVRALVEENAFKTYDFRLFSGTSAGGLVAAACWVQAMQDLIANPPPQAPMVPLPQCLEKMWLDNAYNIIPNEAVGDWVKSFDRGARHNPGYDWMAQNFGVPVMRGFFRYWIRKYIDRETVRPCVEKLYAEYRDNNLKSESLPGLVLGSADILQGEIMAFSEYDIAAVVGEAYEAAINQGVAEQAALDQAYDHGVDKLYDFIEASGSLEEVNGTTEITYGSYKGTYLDGAWGQNPPVDDLLDYEVDEIWIVEIFPKLRGTLPRTYAEREDRKEELMQNALVEHELHMIDKVNKWIGSGRLITDYTEYRDYLNWRAERYGEKSLDNEIVALSEEEFKTFRHIETRRMPMMLNFTPGARIVNSPQYLRDKMDYGYANAKHFLIHATPTNAAS